MSSTGIEYTKKELPAKLSRTGLILLLIGLISMAAAYYLEGERAAYNNVWILTFITSIGIGSLFWVAIEYLAGADWSTPFRRVMEILSYLLILGAIIAIPAYLSSHSLFHWAHPEAVQNDPMLKAKSPYLNVPFFGVRQLIYFGIWFLFFFLFVSNSKKQDISGDQKLTKRNIKLSAIFMPLFAFTITFFSIDWLMSLEPHWFSTIFGVYYFSGSVLAAMAVITYVSIKLNEAGYLMKGLTKDNYYSFGALMFAFLNFWAYIAFSQFLLIWYANLPEETVWFLQRWEGTWLYFTVGLIFVHFFIPYFGLLSQPSKMNAGRLKFMALWIVFAHLYDLYWMVMPTYSPKGVLFGWVEIGAVIFMVGGIITVFAFVAKGKNLAPIKDPKLKRGIKFTL